MKYHGAGSLAICQHISIELLSLVRFFIYLRLQTFSEVSEQDPTAGRVVERTQVIPDDGTEDQSQCHRYKGRYGYRGVAAKSGQETGRVKNKQSGRKQNVGPLSTKSDEQNR